MKSTSWLYWIILAALLWLGQAPRARAEESPAVTLVASYDRLEGRVAMLSGETPTTSGEPAALAQVTPTAEGYPAPQEEPPGASPTSPAAGPEGEVPGEEAYPGGASPIGRGNDLSPAGAGESGADQASQQGNSDRNSRFLLWLGFVGGLLVFVGGVFFSIVLSTRRQQTESLE